MQMEIIDFNGKKIGEVSLADSVFGLEPRADILQRIVIWQRAKAHAGTHKVKTVSEVKGSGKKAYKQKRTGRARQGERYNVQMRGGGIAHGSVVRSHEIDLPKKIRNLGLKMALSSKAKDGDLVVIQSEKLPSIKTSALAKKLKNLGLDSALFITANLADENFKKSVANIANIDILPTAGLNVLDILGHKKLVLTADAVEPVTARMKGEKVSKAQGKRV